MYILCRGQPTSLMAVIILWLCFSFSSVMLSCNLLLSICSLIIAFSSRSI